jgi:hypothetical protein
MQVSAQTRDDPFDSIILPNVRSRISKGKGKHTVIGAIRVIRSRTFGPITKIAA